MSAREKKYIPVENTPGMVRDARSGAILNINSSELDQARQRKVLREEKKKQDMQLREDVEDLKNEIYSIKSLLTQIVEKL
jgi:hypothetical protein